MRSKKLQSHILPGQANLHQQRSFSHYWATAQQVDSARRFQALNACLCLADRLSELWVDGHLPAFLLDLHSFSDTDIEVTSNSALPSVTRLLPFLQLVYTLYRLIESNIVSKFSTSASPGPASQTSPPCIAPISEAKRGVEFPERRYYSQQSRIQ
ncbi:unnamed protein product [Protopolystoma xenopodis]|uniref:Uncharacterized protein n=1 Tax=Protopolystoma xenopodis TaxID=117903 RepID=A0A448WTW7_9PLAT|nr:unnamed protein product [Protopolystoma xenopodis]